MITIDALLSEGKTLLKNFSKIDTPDLDAALLLADILGVDRYGLFLAASETVPEDKESRYRQVLKRRLDGECVAYIIGYKEFWGLRFAVNNTVLTPRPDTETLAEAALLAAQDACSALDLCTGSGIIAVVLKREFPQLSVTASDISKAALETARANAENLNADIRFIESDLFERIDGVFDIIVSNPPYIPTSLISTLSPEVQKEPFIALDGGADGLDIIKRIIIDAKPHLNRKGKLFLEASPEQTPFIDGFLRAQGYQDVNIRQDLAGLDRVIESVFD